MLVDSFLKLRKYLDKQRKKKEKKDKKAKKKEEEKKKKEQKGEEQNNELKKEVSDDFTIKPDEQLISNNAIDDKEIEEVKIKKKKTKEEKKKEKKEKKKEKKRRDLINNAFKSQEKNKFDYFTTTLSVSPYKNSKWINEIGLELEKKYDIKYLYSDFKRNDGYKESIRISKEYGLYRQEYCGCEFSLKEKKIE